ncbi:MAG TPA: TonB-dependent receptor [Chiayiivirga sp.]|nr:TonB-dependent receptor [Chiayiivirga sp.]
MKNSTLSLAILLALGAASARAQPTQTPGLAAPEPEPSPTELSEVVVEQAFVPEEGGQFDATRLRRESAQLLDVLSSEQISRSGDSDAAVALRRVTGLSLVDDRFIYVRGLGERYSSTLLNGARIPSPDPTRRVVPMDLFPTGLLSGIEVHKSYSPALPGEFGGGTVDLRTRGIPTARLFKVDLGLGYADGTTGRDGWRSASGERDWLGRDDGLRAPPAGVMQRPLPPRGSAELAALGREVMARPFGLSRRALGPDANASLSFGDVRGDEDLRGGFIAAARWSQGWDLREEDRAEYARLGNGSLVASEEYRRERTERSVESSLFLSGGFDIGPSHHLDATLLRLAQSLQQDRIDTGLRAMGTEERSTRSEWVENTLTSRQFGGEHRFEDAGDAQLTWQVTDSDATRDMPFARSYLYALDAAGEYAYTSSFPAQMRWEQMRDDAREARVDVSLPFALGEAVELTMAAGGSRLRRERDSEIWRLSVRHLAPLPDGHLPIDEILSPENIDAGRIELMSASQPTDFYQARQRLDAAYLRADVRAGRLRADLGLRRENNDQRVVTQDPFLPGAVPTTAHLEGGDFLPSATLTWGWSEHSRLRASWNRTLARPEFRELSRAPYTDPLLDVTVIGNPALRQTGITSQDLRWEHYFSGSDGFSVALFRKRFEAPIELVRTPASSELLELRNAETAFVRGIELEIGSNLGYFADAGWMPEALREAIPWYDLAASLNHTRIQSEVDLGASAGIQTSSERPLQGQSPYLTNLALTWYDPDAVHEATVLYNVAGKRISKVGLQGLPDEYEEPFHQLDFSYSGRIAEGWKLRLRLRNLLDPEVQYTQGAQTSRSYRKGREIAVNLEWSH